jgi:hypothetical protein
MNLMRISFVMIARQLTKMKGEAISLIVQSLVACFLRSGQWER